MAKPAISIAEHIEMYLEFCRDIKRIKPGTIIRLRSDFNSFLKVEEIDSSKPMSKLNNDDVDRWIAAQSRAGISGRSINCRVRNFKAMVKWLRGMNVKIPNLKVSLIIKQPEQPPRRNCFTWREVERALNYADERTWLMISLCYSCGLRLSEMLNLKVENITGRQLHFIGKCDIDGKVVMSKMIAKRLNAWLNTNRITTGYIFPGAAGNGHCSVCAARDHMKAAFKRAGIDGFYPHALRHSFASELLENGARIDVIQKMLRHVSIENTQRYAREIEDHTYYNFDKYMHRHHRLKFSNHIKMVLLNLLDSATIKLTRSLSKK